MSVLSSYPREIVEALLRRWAEQRLPDERFPPPERLAALVDGAYQATLLREEGHLVRCRLVAASPDDFDAADSGLHTPHVLRFAEPLEFTPHQVRKLAAAVGTERALLAVGEAGGMELALWGMITPAGGATDAGVAAASATLGSHLVLGCTGPGRLVAGACGVRLLEVSGGRILTDGFDPFHSRWLPERFGALRASLLEQLNRDAPGGPLIEDDFIKNVAQSVVRRALGRVRSRGHGGMLIYLPAGAGADPQTDRWLRFRVRVAADEAATRFRTLMLSLLRGCSDIAGELGRDRVTWSDFRRMHDARLAEPRDLLIEFAELLADLMSIDGSLVLDRGFRLIGFGAEILGDSHAIAVHRATDLEAERVVAERADSSGTRHRSAYRLVSGWPDTVAVVVSQDGDVRFVAHHGGRVTYWPYLP